MAEQATEDAVMKQRIITHMNNDHQDSLIRYLEHFCGLSSLSARNAFVQDINFDTITIATSSGKGHVIPIKPPIAAWSDIRPRVVAMDAEAIAGLGRSAITVKKYVKPYGFMLVVFVACILTFINFSRRSNFERGSLLYETILKYVPWFAKFCWNIQPLVIYPMVLLHGSEAIYMARGRLVKHNVPLASPLWMEWVMSTFIEGYGSFVRFDDAVKKEEKRRANAKH